MSRQETVELPEAPTRLVLNVPSGRAEIRQSEDDAVHVSIDGDRAEDVVVSASGDTVTIRHDPPQGQWGIGRLRFDIRIPVGMDLDFRSASLNLRSTVDLGSVDAATASGNLRFESVGSLTAKTASGDLRVGDVHGDVRAKSASGDLKVKAIGKDLAANTASGDIAVEEVGGRVDVKTASGDIRIESFSGTELAVKTVSGNTSVSVPPGTTADLDLNSLSGNIRLPKGPASEVDPSDRVRRRLRFRSVSGDFRLRVG